MRTTLYMAALTATRRTPTSTPSISAYQRLLTAGKPAKVALVACLHKLLVLCNALCRDRTLWDPTVA